MIRINHYLTKSMKRAKRVRSKLHGSAKQPRVTVYRSNKFIYIQVIDDDKMATLAAANDLDLKKNAKKSETKMERAKLAAESIAKQLKAKKISNVVFDRGSYKYHGRVRQVAETLREQGIKV